MKKSMTILAAMGGTFAGINLVTGILAYHQMLQPNLLGSCVGFVTGVAGIVVALCYTK